MECGREFYLVVDAETSDVRMHSRRCRRLELLTKKPVYLIDSDHAFTGFNFQAREMTKTEEMLVKKQKHLGNLFQGMSSISRLFFSKIKKTKLILMCCLQ